MPPSEETYETEQNNVRPPKPTAHPSVSWERLRKLAFAYQAYENDHDDSAVWDALETARESCRLSGDLDPEAENPFDRLQEERDVYRAAFRAVYPHIHYSFPENDADRAVLVEVVDAIAAVQRLELRRKDPTS